MKVRTLKIAAVTIAVMMTAALCGCVDQHPEENSKAESSVQSADELRIAATSPAVADICDKLDIDLVGVCTSSISTIPRKIQGRNSARHGNEPRHRDTCFP